MLPRLLFRSTAPALVAHSLQDDGGDDRELGPTGLRFPAGTFFVLTLTFTIGQVLCFLVKYDSNKLACYIDSSKPSLAKGASSGGGTNSEERNSSSRQYVGILSTAALEKA